VRHGRKKFKKSSVSPSGEGGGVSGVHQLLPSPRKNFLPNFLIIIGLILIKYRHCHEKLMYKIWFQIVDSIFC
jgi:hypothetical protein